MRTAVYPTRRSVNWRVLALMALLLAALVPALGRGATSATPARADVLYHAPSQLLAIAAHHPTQPVRVIVELTGHSSAPQQLVQRLGGHILRTLSIIHAFVAVLPAAAARRLSTLDSVNWLTLDAPTHAMSSCSSCISTTKLVNAYDGAIGAPPVWNGSKFLQGQGIGVAVLDSGVTPVGDLTNGKSARVTAAVNLATGSTTTADKYGHGTHVAGIIGGNGSQSNGQYIGIAPKANIINVKVAGDNGQASTSDVVAGLQWVLTNAATYNIKVVNISMNSTLAESYNVDPLDAACEILWNNKIVVVVSAGNNQLSNPGVIYPPANDPFVITVGAVDDQGTSSPSDDTLAPFSAYGTTTDGFAKPDLVAPGVNLISDLASSTDALATAHPTNVVGSSYFMMSGTSMAAPVVSAAAALLLQSNPNLNPDQVKQRLLTTASPLSNMTGVGAGEVNIAAAVAGNGMKSANTGVAPSQLLHTGTKAVSWTSWDSASWGSASWGSVNWGSVSWGSASWGSDYWNSPHTHHG